MRKLLFTVLLAAMGCGGSSGGGGVRGTISGRAFDPVDVEAVLAGPATCTVPVLGAIEARAFAIRFATYAGVCDDFGDPFCRVHAGAEAITVIFADLSQATSIPTGLAPGTYAVGPDPTVVVPQTSGPLANTAVVAFAASLLTGSSCEPTPTVAQGTLRIDAVSDSATVISGHLDLTFGTYDTGTQTFTPGAGSLSGDFSAPVCASQTISDTDLCAIAVGGPECTGTPTCL